MYWRQNEKTQRTIICLFLSVPVFMARLTICTANRIEDVYFPGSYVTLCPQVDGVFGLWVCQLLTVNLCLSERDLYKYRS